MNRHLSAVVAAALVASGALVSACGLSPSAATANGTTISIASLNGELHALGTTAAGACLLELESPQSASASGQGAGGSGTYSTGFAATVLESQVGELLAQQYATSKGLSVSAADLAAAKTDLESTLDGEIQQALQQATSEGGVTSCETVGGTAMTGAQLLAGLPSSLASTQVMAQAYDEELLADGANLSESAITGYYDSNKAEFTEDCVSRIVTSSESAANRIVSELDAGASFASLAKSSSIDTQTASSGGSLGCAFSEAEIEQELEQESVPVGRPLAPIQNSQSGQWFVYEVTSQSVQPLSAVVSVVKRELLQSTSNVNRISAEIIAFAHRSDVSIDPQYGSWSRLAVVPPVAPPSRYLLAAASGTDGSSSTLLGG